MKSTQKQIENLIKRIIREEEESFDLKKTVMDTAQFEEEDVPYECIDDPSKPRIETIQACMAKITEKSTALTNAIKALNELQTKAEGEANSIKLESRRHRRKLY
jgi:hypothetical protein